MADACKKRRLRLTCPPCGHVFSAETEDMLVRECIEHARAFHDLDLPAQLPVDELRAQIRNENEAYWAYIDHLIPDDVKSVIDEALLDREREIVAYVVHGFSNREIATRLSISERTISTHLEHIYEKLNVHSRAELTALVRAADRIIQAGLRMRDRREFGPFIRVNPD